MLTRDLQAALCLALAVPNTELEIQCRSGTTIVASARDGDLSLVQLRRAALAGLHPELTDCARWIDAVRLTGALRPHRDELHIRAEPHELWFATLETPRRAAKRFRSIGVERHPGVLVSIHPDRLLGVAAVRVRSLDPHTDLVAVGTELHRAVTPTAQLAS